MLTIDFIEQYANNMYQSLQEGRADLTGLNFDCDFCPLRAECAADQVHEGCTSFLLRTLRDGSEFATKLNWKTGEEYDA